MGTPGLSLRVLVLTGIALALLGGSPARAQHETASDLQDGARQYENTCATCHGPDGNLIAGIDLGRGLFRRPLTDEDLVRIIRTGIPNTPMPPSSLSVEQASQIVAYLRSLAASTGTPVAGDATRGQTVFEGKGGCLSCHRVHAIGSRVGPDLSSIAAARRAVELERALLDPEADVQPSNRYYRVVTEGGTTVSGRLLNLDTFTVQLIDTDERLRSFVKADLRAYGFLTTPMPSFRGTLTPQEIADVVSYLSSLR
jgi:putative heme-binding domain-containing protein